MTGFFRWVEEILVNTPPGLARLMKIQPVFALVSSFFVLFLFEKGFEKAPLIIALCLFAVFYITSKLYFIKDPKGVFTMLLDTALVFALSSMLLFVTPFYLESMSIPSRNMLFTPLILALAVIANWYELYLKIIAPHPLRSSLFYALTFFCVLNFLLPVIFGVRNIWSLMIAGAASALMALVFVYPKAEFMKSGRNTAMFFAGIALFLAFLWAGRSFIPPAPLRLTRATACKAIEAYRPAGAFSSAPLEENPEVYFYSAIFAPRGLAEKINHVWRHNGRRLFTVYLSEIRGGRKAGFGTWSKHRILEGAGTYTVEVWTAGGQYLGSEKFVLR